MGHSSLVSPGSIHSAKDQRSQRVPARAERRSSCQSASNVLLLLHIHHFNEVVKVLVRKRLYRYACPVNNCPVCVVALFSESSVLPHQDEQLLSKLSKRESCKSLAISFVTGKPNSLAILKDGSCATSSRPFR